jgi:ATP-binding cassette subfamily C protein CydD
VVTVLPRGLDHLIGQSGAGLSGGEKQRIALARVILQRRPILLLDEVLTGLDIATKLTLLSRLESFAISRMIVMVSHDPICKQWTDSCISLCPPQEELACEPSMAAMAETIYGPAILANRNHG